MKGANDMSDSIYEPLIEKYLPKIKQMRLLDDDFMSAAFDNDIEGTQVVLRTILDKEDLVVERVTSQRELKNIYGRSVRLDVYATDSTGKKYDIEIQRADRGAGEKRARYNQSIIDTNNLPAGKDTNDLPEVYIIFFTEHDVREKGLPVYHVERVVVETGELFNDGEHIIYVNGAYQDDGSALGSIISDFRESDPDKIRSKSLAKRIKYLKESKEGVSHMCRIVEDIVKKEREEAFNEAYSEAFNDAFLQLVQSMSEQKFSLAQMTTLSKRSEDEVIAALKKLGLPIPE